MPKKSPDLLQGTLDMLVLKTLTLEPMHGYAIMRRIHDATDEVLQIEEGSLYPALYRMKRRGWLVSEWGVSEKKRRAKFYRLTDVGRRQLEEEIANWQRLSTATGQVLNLNGKT